MTLHYNFEEIIGSAVLDPSGKVVITLHDPRVVEHIKREQKIVGITLVHQPSVPSQTDRLLVEEIFAEGDRDRMTEAERWDNDHLSPHMD